MPTQTTEITVDVPEGYELTGEYRYVNPCGWYMDDPGRVHMWMGHGRSAGSYLILRKLPDPEPEVPLIECSYLADGWAAADASGGVYWYGDKPSWDDLSWSSEGEHQRIAHTPIAAELRDLPSAESLRRVIYKEPA